MKIRIHTWAQAVALPRRYGAYAADVDPRAIRYLKRANEWAGYVKWWPWMVCGGNWDLAKSEHPPFREEQMKQLFVDRIPYRETTRYREMVAEVQRYGRTRFLPRCHSVDEIDHYFEGVLALYQRMKTEGYQRRTAETADAGEISVRIGRDGTLIKCGEGTHRLAIARVLAIPTVPVVVDLVHWQWAKACVKRRGPPLRLAIRQELSGSPGVSTADVAT